VHGGKTDQFNSYSYSSAPNNDDLLYLSLTFPFEASSPPWQLVSSASNSSASQGPALSWHILSAFNTSEVLLFGGQPGPNSPTVLVGEADSAFLLDIFNRRKPEWISEATSWAGQPTRRIYHSSATTVSGRVLIIGGEKADGSNTGFPDHYVFDPVGPSFTLLPTNNSPPDISGHKSIMLADGHLLVFGGYSHSQGLLIPFTTIWAIDTTQSNASWTLLSVSDTSLPSPRRAFVAVLLANGKILIHGGSDAVFQNTYADGWILDTSQTPMVWTKVDALSQLGPRRDHLAISYGNQVIFAFGMFDSYFLEK
jgi:N-acetylneuraminic acid mutarotase